MKTIYIGAKDSFELRNVDIKGFLIKVRGLGSGVDVTPVDVPYLPKINVKLKQGNFNGTILDGSILGLSKGTSARLENWAESDALSVRVVTEADAETKGVTEWVYKVELPSVINLNDSDVMSVEVDFPAGSMASHDSAGTFLTIKEIAGIGNQAVVPRVIEYIMPKLDARFDKQLGNNITRVVFVGAASNTPFKDGLLEVDMKSDRKDYTMTMEEIHYEGVSSKFNSVIALNEFQNDVIVKCTMDGLSNDAGELRMIVSDFWSDSAMINKAQVRGNWQSQSLKQSLVAG